MFNPPTTDFQIYNSIRTTNIHIGFNKLDGLSELDWILNTPTTFIVFLIKLGCLLCVSRLYSVSVTM